MDVSITYSGGSDSTLAAVLGAEKFDKVHLLTFHRFAMFREGKAKVNVENLKRAFGKDKFIWTTIGIDSLFKFLFRLNYSTAFKNYKDYAPTLLTCGICRLCMHTETIIYNLKNGIYHTYDGEQRGRLFPTQVPEALKILGNFYKEFGMAFNTPVYGIMHTDWELYERRIVPKRNYKNEILIYSNQHTCPFGILAHFDVKIFRLYRFGRKSRRNYSIRFLKENIPKAKDYIRCQVK
jgi:hypothetical protein